MCLWTWFVKLVHLSSGWNIHQYSYCTVVYRYVHSAHQHQPFAEWRLLFTIGSSPTRYFQFKDRFALFFSSMWEEMVSSEVGIDLRVEHQRIWFRNCGPYRDIPFYLALRKSSTLLRYLRGRSSNMAIVDVEIPTGYIYTGNRFLDDFVSWQRIEDIILSIAGNDGLLCQQRSDSSFQIVLLYQHSVWSPFLLSLTLPLVFSISKLYTTSIVHSYT